MPPLLSLRDCRDEIASYLAKQSGEIYLAGSKKTAKYIIHAEIIAD